MEKLEAAEREIVRTRTRREVLTELIRRAESAAARRVELAECVAAGEYAVGIGTDIAGVVARRTALAGVLDAVHRAKAAGAAGVPKAAWDALAAVRAKADDAAKRRVDLEAALGRVTELGGVVCRLSDAVGRSEAELAETVARTGGDCPTCGRPLPAGPSQSASATPISAPASRPPAGKPRTSGGNTRSPT